jgi:endonuclease/exonuclease/phosphatase family metal-dependent hydrolase
MSPLVFVLTVVTLNVYQTFQSPKQRYEAIAAELSTLAPDVVTFQEVARRGKVTSVDGLLPDYYRVVQGRPGGYVQGIVSRYPIVRTIEVPFRNNRRRMALGAVIAVPTAPGAREILVLTTHLDYQLDHHAQRRAQLVAILEEAGRFEGPVILTGDFNFGDGEPEGKVIPPAFVDAFRVRNEVSPGFTWDRAKNAMADAGSLAGEPSRRLDRIFVRQLEVVSSDLQFTKPVRPGLWPSDHFGLVARLGQL